MKEKTNLTVNKQKFLEILNSVDRKNIDSLIKVLETEGFFEAPASTKFHGNYPGGLVEHSLNVYTQAMYLYNIECKLKKDIAKNITKENVIIASLLHDVCKSNLYTIVKKWRKDDKNKWEQYDTYDHDYSNLPIGHGEKSVVKILLSGVELTEDEILAIRWHMGGFDISTYGDAKQSFNVAGDKSPLVPIIMCADVLASRITENDFDKKKE